MELTERRSACNSAILYLHAYKQYRLGTQVVGNIIKYAITDREIERPSTKEKRPHFLLLFIFLFIFLYICMLIVSRYIVLYYYYAILSYNTL